MLSREAHLRSRIAYYEGIGARKIAEAYRRALRARVEVRHA